MVQGLIPGVFISISVVENHVTIYMWWMLMSLSLFDPVLAATKAPCNLLIISYILIAFIIFLFLYVDEYNVFQ